MQIFTLTSIAIIQHSTTTKINRATKHPLITEIWESNQRHVVYIIGHPHFRLHKTSKFTLFLQSSFLSRSYNTELRNNAMMRVIQASLFLGLVALSFAFPWDLNLANIDEQINEFTRDLEEAKRDLANEDDGPTEAVTDDLAGNPDLLGTIKDLFLNEENAEAVDGDKISDNTKRDLPCHSRRGCANDEGVYDRILRSLLELDGGDAAPPANADESATENVAESVERRENMPEYDIEAMKELEDSLEGRSVSEVDEEEESNSGPTKVDAVKVKRCLPWDCKW